MNHKLYLDFRYFDKYKKKCSKQLLKHTYNPNERPFLFINKGVRITFKINYTSHLRMLSPTNSRIAPCIRANELNKTEQKI